MFPGLNPRQMQQMMQKMGIRQVEIPATEVIIKTKDKDLIISHPQVSKVNLMGQETFQIVGEAHEQAPSSLPEFSPEDIQTIIDQAHCSEKAARQALQESQGDLAQAILKLKKD